MVEVNTNDPNVRNKYGMTQAQWNDYQAEIQSQPEGIRTGPMYYQWARQLNGLNQGVSPSDNLSPVYGAFEPVSNTVSSVDVYNQGVQAEQAKNQAQNKQLMQDIDNQSTANYQKQVDYEAAGMPGAVVSKGKSAPVTNKGRTAAQIAAQNSAGYINSSGGGFITVTDPDTHKTNLETQAAERAAAQYNAEEQKVIKQGASNPNSNNSYRFYESNTAEKTANKAEYEALLKSGKTSTRDTKGTSNIFVSNEMKRGSGTKASSNHEYNEAVEKAQAQKAEQEILFATAVANPLLDSNGNAINQITDKNGNAIKSNSNTTQIISPIYGSDAAKNADTEARKKEYNILIGSGKSSKGSGSDNIGAEKYTTLGARDTAAIQNISQKRIEESRKINDYSSTILGTPKAGITSIDSNGNLSIDKGDQKSFNDLQPFIPQERSIKDTFLDKRREVDAWVSGGVREMGKDFMIGARLAAGYNVSESEVKALKGATTLGVEKREYTGITNYLDEKLPDTIFSSEGVKRAAEGFERFEERVTSVALEAIPDPIRDAAGNISNKIKGNNSNVFTTFAGNIIRSAEKSDKILPGILMGGNEIPKHAIGALKEGETLARNTDKILPTLAYGVGAAAAGTVKAFYDDPVETTAYFIAQDAAIKGAAKGIKVTAELGGEGTGLVRKSIRETNSLEGNQVTLRSRGSVAEEILYGESSTIHVTRSGMFNPKVGKPFSKYEGTSPQIMIYDKNGNLIVGEAERKAARQAIQRGSTEYTYSDIKDPLVSTLEHPAHGIFASTGIEQGVEPVSNLFTKQLGQGSLTDRFKRRNTIMDVDKVNMPAELKQAIANDISNTGEISKGNYDQMVKLGQAQVKETGKPVAIIPPKTRAGWLQGENEIFILTDEASSIVTSKSFAGYSESGVRTERISMGKQDTVPSAVTNIYDNLKFNYNVGVDRYSLNSGKILYNKGIQAGEEALIINPRAAELYTHKKITQPGSWENELHGKEHTDQVGRNITNLSKEKDLGISDEYASLLGTAHDIDKLGYFDNPGVDHGIVAARAIREGRTGLPQIDLLSKAERYKLADDVAYHDRQQPLSIWHPIAGAKTELIYKPSLESKALSNADRIDLKRFHTDAPSWSPDNHRMFNLKPKRSVEELIQESSLPTGFKQFASDNTASFMGKRKQIRKEPGAKPQKIGETEKPYKGEYAKGYGEGYKGEYTKGYGEGYKGEYTKGYGEGYKGEYAKGYGEGYKGAYTKGYVEGYKGEYAKSYGEGYKGEYAKSYGEGYKGEYAKSYGEGYKGEYAKGYGEGYKGEYTKGYGEGYKGGYTGGYKEGYKGEKGAYEKPYHGSKSTPYRAPYLKPPETPYSKARPTMHTPPAHPTKGAGKKRVVFKDDVEQHKQKPTGSIIRWKEYTKKHYVVDPWTFVLGKKGGR